MHLHGITRKKTGPTARPVAERFWSKVNKAGPLPVSCPDLGPCWIWTGAIGRGGYGNFAHDASNTSHCTINAHRWAYEAEHGPVPNGLKVLHHCDIRRCVNPGHLFLGTTADNSADMTAKGRHRHKSYQKVRAVDVPMIRARLALGERRRAIADDYGVSTGAIGAIARDEMWRHV